MPDEVLLDQSSVRIHDFEPLRQRFQVFITGGPLRRTSQRFHDGILEFGRQGSFQADERYALLAVVPADLDAIGGMGVDDQAG